MAGTSSPYYPPRSRWYSPLRYFWFGFRRRIPTIQEQLQRLQPSIGLRDTLLSLIIPGFVFHAFGYRRVGKFALFGFSLALLIYFIWLGYPAATIAFSLILSLHVSSVAYFIHRCAPNLNFISRILSTLAVLFAINIFVYGFLQNQLELHLMPLRIGENVVVVKGWGVKNLKHDDWIAYRIEGSGAGYRDNIVVADGFGLDRIMAGPGDTLRFSPTEFHVNATSFPRQTSMPMEGELIVAEKHWFVWPKFAIRSQGIPEVQIAKRLQKHAMISEDQLVGKPFKRWFWRKQILP